uniref:Regulatory protein zeste n=1 Tax=Stegastes partitus TaxID=144197 RepID=A0A3B4ZP87_9TELE
WKNDEFIKKCFKNFSECKKTLSKEIISQTLQQLQVVWKNIKIHLKKTTAMARRECFKTGGGPPVWQETDDFGDLLTGMIESQQLLEGIPDDDHLDSSGGETLQYSFILEEPEQRGEYQPSTPVAAAATISNPGSGPRGKRLTIHEKLAIEFHECKLQYLKEEHELKMKILHVELSNKKVERAMKQQQFVSALCNNAHVNLVPL